MAEQKTWEQERAEQIAKENHRKWVNAVAMDALLDVIPGFNNEWARKVILTIESGRIPRVKITY